MMKTLKTYIYVSSDGKSKKPRRGRKHKEKKSHLMSRKKKTVTDKGNEEESEAYRRLRVAMQNMYAFNKEEPTVKCIACEIYFYSEDGMRTHFQHAHTNIKGIGMAVNNEAETDATLKDDSAVETQNELSQDHERETVANVDDTEQSELPDIVPPTQTITCGRKHSQNECDANVCKKKRSRGSPSPSKRRVQKDNSTTGTNTNPVTTNIPEVNLRRKKSEVSDDSRTGMNTNLVTTKIPEVNLRRKKSEVSDDSRTGMNTNPVTTKIPEVNLRRKKSEVSDESTPTSKHFTRSHKTGMQTNDDDMTHATVKQSKKKANTKDFQTKPIPEKKRKKEVDANEIIKTHTKKGVEDHEEETQQKTTQISKKTDRKAYTT